MAWPCECVTIGASTPDYRAALRHTEAVFGGTVLQVQDLRLPTIPPREGSFLPYRMVVFDADVAWAGVKSRRVLVFTGTGGGDCGYSFEVGRAYVVWANRDDWRVPQDLSTGICTFTAPLEAAEEQMRQLGTPKALRQ